MITEKIIGHASVLIHIPTSHLDGAPAPDKRCEAALTVEIIRRALDEELVSSPSEKGPLRIAFPHKVLDAWFPQLFTDLPVQEP